LLRQNPIYPAAYVDELEKKVKERLKTFDVAELVIPAYAKNFSIDELKEILAFQTSPTGRKLASVNPEILNETIQAVRDWAFKMGPPMTQEILEEHPEFEKEIEANKAKLASSGSAASANSPGGVYRIGGDVSAPVLTSRIEPEYTADAAHSKLEGEVLLSVVIDEKGVPQDIRVMRPLGKGLDEKAIEAVEQWRFRPGMKNGAPVKTMAQILVNFHLLKRQ
jgi:TonB family protein